MHTFLLAVSAMRSCIFCKGKEEGCQQVALDCLLEDLPESLEVGYLYAVQKRTTRMLHPDCIPIQFGRLEMEDVLMTYVIAEPCVDVIDQACVDVCPVDCIHFDEGVDRKLYIDPDECIDCGACEPECPVEAIFAEEDVPEEWKGYTEIDVLWFKDKDAARAKVNELRPE